MWLLCRKSLQRECHGLPVPVIRRETESYKSLFLDNEHRTQHYSFHEAVHCEALDFGSGKRRGLDPMGDDIGRGIQKQPECIGPEGIA